MIAGCEPDLYLPNSCINNTLDKGRETLPHYFTDTFYKTLVQILKIILTCPSFYFQKPFESQSRPGVNYPTWFSFVLKIISNALHWLDAVDLLSDWHFLDYIFFWTGGRRLNLKLDLHDKTAADPLLQLNFHRHVIHVNFLSNHNVVSHFPLFVDSINAGCPRSHIWWKPILRKLSAGSFVRV